MRTLARGRPTQSLRLPEGRPWQLTSTEVRLRATCATHNDQVRIRATCFTFFGSQDGVEQIHVMNPGGPTDST